MNISDIITKCYILALIIRDDGERLLLGDGFYEFKEQLQHFQPNIFQNDVIELQGTDGQLLAGQVRRGATQSFDGYIADATISREATEEHRQRFLGFFLKKHHYKVVYVFPDGTAIKRERGYIVDAPSVPEMFQRFPEFHVGLNFEDVNYYEYEEGEDGEEIFAHVQSIAIAGYVEGGLIWDNYGAVSNEITWVDYALKTTTDGYAQITDGVLGAPMNLEQLFGNTTQETLSGKNLLNLDNTFERTYPNDLSYTQKPNSVDITANTTTGAQYVRYIVGGLDATKDYTLSFKAKKVVKGTDGRPYIRVQTYGSTDGTTWTNVHYYENADPTQGTEYSGSLALTGYTYYRIAFYNNTNTPVSTGERTQYYDIQLEEGTQATAYEPYCGGVPSPNPSYPQEVKTVTGEQTLTVTGKNLFGGLTECYVSYCTYTLVDNILTITPSDTTHNPGVGFLLGSPILSGATVHLSSATTVSTSTQLRDYSSTVVANFGGGIDTTKTLSGTADRIMFNWASTGSTTPFTVDLSTLQIELGSTKTTYEPYQGQSYKINLGGTNLLPSTGTTQAGGTGVSITRNNDGTYTVNGTASSGGYIEIGTIDFKQGQTYTISGITVWTATTLQLFTISDTAFPLGYRLASYNGPTTQTALGDETCVVRLYVYQGTTYNNVVVKPQVQLGSKATPYAPHTDYAYELCKIGDYRDRIYENDGEWYIHEEIAKYTLDGSDDETWYVQQSGTANYFYRTDGDNYATGTGRLSNYFTATTITTANTLVGFYVVNTNQMRFRPNFAELSIPDWRTWLSTHNTTVYYALATPTDTKITDQTLIQQLSTIKALVGETNNIFLIPSAGAQGEMEVRYSRGFINQGAGYVWDAAQGGGPNVVSVDGIDRTGFVWEVVGPATNPTLTNITTNQTMTFEGSVAAGQTLTVNTSDQTAEIAGTNVFAQMEGDWMQLAPGNNVITYTATGATEPSKIKWNGVVG